MRKKLQIEIPVLFQKRYIELFGSRKKFEDFLRYIDGKHVKSLRINPKEASNSEKIINDLRLSGIKVVETGIVENSYVIIESPKGFNFFDLESVAKGQVYIQDASSMLAPTVMEIPDIIPKDFKVLDVRKKTKINLLLFRIL